MKCSFSGPGVFCVVSAVQLIPCSAGVCALRSFPFLIRQVLYSDSFRKQVQGKAAYVLDTPEMRRVRETQKHISTVRAFLCVFLSWKVI